MFDKSRFPQLPYEKFVLLDALSGKALEVWAVSEQNNVLFDKLDLHRNHPAGHAHVRGKIVGVDRPMMNSCSRGIQLEILYPEDLFFKTKD